MNDLLLALNGLPTNIPYYEKSEVALFYYGLHVR